MRGSVLCTALLIAGCTPSRVALVPPMPCTCGNAAPSELAAIEAPLVATGERPARDLDEEIAFECARHQVGETFAKAPPTCDALDSDIAKLIAALESELLADIRDARAGMLVNDATPTEEKQAIARARYEAALATFTTRVASRAKVVVIAAWFRQAPVAKSYTDALYEAFSYSLYLEERVPPNPLKPTPEFEARFDRVAARFYAERLEQTAEKCAVAAVDARRGRWIAAFNGKLLQ